MRSLIALISLPILATASPAQFTGTGDQPLCFLWEASPSGWDDDDFDQRFVPIVRVDIANRTGSGAAAAVKATVADLVAQFPASDAYIRDHICILLQNFGVTGTTALAQDSVVAPEWHQDETSNDMKRPERNPWLNTGTEAAKAWMEDFIEALSSSPASVTPFRFHFDSEVPLCSYGLHNEVRIARNVMDSSGDGNYDRWDDPDWKIPYGDQNAKTLASWWADAVVEYPDFALANLGDPPQMLNPDSYPFSPQDYYIVGDIEYTCHNREFFLWYQRILDMARDGAMKYAAYDPIRTEWPSCEISNYEDTRIPQGYTVSTSDAFGWQFDFTTQNSAVPQPEDSFPSRELPLGFFKPHNASYGVEDSGTYFITPGNYRSGTMNAPVLYAVVEDHVENLENELIQRNLYEPHAAACETVQSGDCDAPMETLWQAAMRVHRHWLESILLSGDEPQTIAPWVLVPGELTFGPYAPSADDISRELCMLRAKSIPELLVWNNDIDENSSPEADWTAFMNVYNRVYTPELYEVYLMDGTLTSGSAQTPERVRRTLFDEYGAPEVISVDSETIGGQEVTSMDFVFTNMGDYTGQDLRIILESAVVPAEEIGSPVVPPIYGKLYIWDGDLADWIELSCPDHAEVSSVPEGSFGYYTPDYTGRRAFDFKDCRIRQIGQVVEEIIVRVVHYSDYAFKARHDLVQVLWAGNYDNCNCDVECEPDDGPENPMRRADFDYNRTIDSTDAAAFDEAYMADRPSADMNRDGILDETDLALFAERFGG